MTISERLRYRFDNLMSRGVGAQVLLLAVVTLVLVAVATGATALWARPLDGDNQPDGFWSVAWLALMHALDPGMLGGDGLTSWLYLFIMLLVTIGGIFVVSALIGVLNQGFGERLDALRRGRSRVVESGHTVVLGWSSKIFPLLAELAEANSNRRGACVVVLADRDKVEMDDEIATFLDGVGASLRVVTRRGEPLSADDLALTAPDRCKAVVVLAPERGPDGAAVSATEADAAVLKALLAIRKVTGDRHVDVVAELLDDRTAAVARMVVADAALVRTGPLIGRLLVQTGRQSGLADVYGELLSFAGSEFYEKEEPALVGTTFADAVHRFGSSTLVGVLAADGSLLLPPAPDRVFAPGDRVLAIAEDDDRVLLDGARDVDETAIAVSAPAEGARPERTLILGTSPRLALVLRELDGFMAPGSTAVVVGEDDVTALLTGPAGATANLDLVTQVGDVTDRSVLDGLDVPGFDHVIVLSESRGRSQDLADARTIVTLLHLRDLAGGRSLPVVSEILDVRNRDLATGGSADDFIVSNRLVSLVLSQIAENPRLAAVFDALMSREGHELYVRPASDYVRLGEVSFGTVCEAALRRGEIAIGYRPAGRPAVVNPGKGERVVLGAADSVVVLAEG